jgi:hypothetical protein
MFVADTLIYGIGAELLLENTYRPGVVPTPKLLLGAKPGPEVSSTTVSAVGEMTSISKSPIYVCAMLIPMLTLVTVAPPGTPDMVIGKLV